MDFSFILLGERKEWSVYVLFPGNARKLKKQLRDERKEWSVYVLFQKCKKTK